MTRRHQIRVYHDGQCAFCRWTQQLVEHRDRERRIEFRDYHECSAETPFARADLERAMHVQALDGRWHTGFFGWLEILRALPRWRRLARLLSVPPLRWIGPLLYRLIAGNRYRIPKFILRWLGAPPPCSTSCEVQPR